MVCSLCWTGLPFREPVNISCVEKPQSLREVLIFGKSYNWQNRGVGDQVDKYCVWVNSMCGLREGGWFSYVGQKAVPKETLESFRLAGPLELFLAS